MLQYYCYDRFVITNEQKNGTYSDCGDVFQVVFLKNGRIARKGTLREIAKLDPFPRRVLESISQSGR